MRRSLSLLALAAVALLCLLTYSPSYAALEALVMLHVWLAGIAM